MTAGPLIREAGPADVEPAVRTLVRAFENYPMTRAGLDPDGYLDRLARYNRLFLTGIGLTHGKVWVSGDRAAVAIWMTPRTPPDAFVPLAEEFRAIAGRQAATVERYGPAIGLLRPKEPVWLLSIVGVDPDHQRRGLGRAVIAPGLACADAENSPVFVETQDAGNVAFYESLGFEIAGEADLPDGPTHWAMYRKPVQSRF